MESKFSIGVQVPEGFEKNTLDVSVGINDICAINEFNSVVCWNYHLGSLKFDKILTPESGVINKFVSMGSENICTVT